MKLYTFHIVPLVLVLILIGAACSSSDQTVKKRPIKEYEGTFDPSKYRDTKETEKQEEDPAATALPETEHREEFVTIERIEQKMGYRIQIFSTTGIDDAEQRRDEYREMLGDSVAVTIVFDAPYYKIRVGNFLEKADAEAERARLKEFGLNEAWVVRDRVNHVVTETMRRTER
jgi:cell division protein FtsN